MKALITFLFACVSVYAAPIETGVMLGVTNSAGSPAVNALWEVDTATGLAYFVGEFDTYISEGGLAVSPSGILYGTFTGSTDELVTIDPLTAEYQFVAKLDFADVSGLAFGSDGVLFGYDDSSCQLITIDPQTGETHSVGPPGGINAKGLAFSPGGELFAVGSNSECAWCLWLLDVETGAASPIGPLGAACDGLPILLSTGLEFIGGDLYASVLSEEFVGGLVSVDLQSGKADCIGEHFPNEGGEMGGLAFLPGAGDVDRDGDVDFSDYDIFVDCYTGPDPKGELPVGCLFLDADKDGEIDCDDWDVFIQNWTEPDDPPMLAECPPCLGDANRDKIIDPLDLGMVLSNFGCRVDHGDPDCDASDANGDKEVDPLDSGFVLARFGECN